MVSFFPTRHLACLIGLHTIQQNGFFYHSWNMSSPTQGIVFFSFCEELASTSLGTARVGVMATVGVFGYDFVYLWNGKLFYSTFSVFHSLAHSDTLTEV